MIKEKDLHLELAFFEGKMETNSECREFIEKIVPEAFQKVTRRVIGKEESVEVSVFSYSTANRSSNGHGKFTVESLICSNYSSI